MSEPLASPSALPLAVEAARRRSRPLRALYLAIAVAALVGTWSQNLAFLARPGSGGLAFVRACFVNPAAASISIDILFLCLAAFVFMVVEGRRLGVRHVWVYLVLSGLVAASVMFPLFLVARQLRLDAVGSGDGAA